MRYVEITWTETVTQTARVRVRDGLDLNTELGRDELLAEARDSSAKGLWYEVKDESIDKIEEV